MTRSKIDQLKSWAIEQAMEIQAAMPALALAFLGIASGVGVSLFAPASPEHATALGGTVIGLGGSLVEIGREIKTGRNSS